MAVGRLLRAHHLPASRPACSTTGRCLLHSPRSQRHRPHPLAHALTPHLQGQRPTGGVTRDMIIVLHELAHTFGADHSHNYCAGGQPTIGARALRGIRLPWPACYAVAAADRLFHLWPHLAAPCLPDLPVHAFATCCCRADDCARSETSCRQPNVAFTAATGQGRLPLDSECTKLPTPHFNGGRGTLMSYCKSQNKGKSAWMVA